jgi:release factor glutamine methyltransferase
MTIREALAEGNASLASAGIESPGLDSSLLLAEVLNTSRSSLTAAGLDPVSQEALATFRQLIKRRQSGECVAYILGRKEFYGLEFLVNPSVLVPRPDTETLVETALKKRTENREQGTENRKQGAESKAAIGGRPFRVLDLCTGSGAIAIALKHTMPELEVWATDISAEALEIAKTNAARLLPPNSIRFLQGDLYDALLPTPNSQLSTLNSQLPTLNSQLSTLNSQLPTPNSQLPTLNSQLPIITSNPPYIPSAEIPSLAPEVRMEPALALDGGGDGLNVIRKIVSRAPEFLCTGGVLMLEADPRQMAAIASLYKEAGFSDIQTHKDLSGRERVISGVKL